MRGYSTRHRRAIALIALLLLGGGYARWPGHRTEGERPPVGRCNRPVARVVGGRRTVFCSADRARPVESPLRGVAPGQEVVVEADGRRWTRPIPGKILLVLGGRIDLNQAGVADLRALPRIGPVLARRIVRDRCRRGPFGSIAQLERVRGIGRRTVQRLRPLLAIGGRSAIRGPSSE